MDETHLTVAADRLGVRLSGPPRFGVDGASASGPAVNTCGGSVWVRVAPARDGVWMAADAAARAGRELGGRVPMPRLLGSDEWATGDGPVRAHVYERLAGQAISPSPEITADPGVDDAWWAGLRSALDVVSTSPAPAGRSARMITHWVHHLTGETVDTATIRWAGSHSDIHWANLYDPLAIVDWEGYSLAPAGFDPALLWVYSLGHEPTARRVEQEFADLLSGPGGRLARLYAAAEVLTAVDAGHHPWLGPLIHRHVAPLSPGQTPRR